MNNLLAYIDPGTTALVGQMVAFVVIATGVILGIWWTKISTFFKGLWVKIFKKNKAEAPDNQVKTDEEEEL